MRRPDSVVLALTLITVSHLGCGDDHERSADLDELLGRSILWLSGPEENRYGPGEMLSVDLDLLEEPLKSADCPVFDVEASVNGRRPVELSGGNWSGGGWLPSGPYLCLAGISFSVRWADEFEDGIEVRIGDDSATFRAVYEAPESPTIELSPPEAAPGQLVTVALEPQPAADDPTAEVSIVGSDGSWLDLGPHPVETGALRLSVPEILAGAATVQVRMDGWTQALVVCEGPIRCEEPDGFLHASTTARAPFTVR